ncbi:Uncharacterised protein [Metakosakonia massiliensis]|uniref:Uncharacterized protein n=2 Tax=Phytobacter massiliensis TaxID=1485952 RepID=A0A6N3AMN8_9ENTR
MRLSSMFGCHKSNEVIYKDHNLAWVFGGNSSVFCFFKKGEPTITTEHWISDLSDVLSFDDKGGFLSLELSIPGYNGFLELNGTQKICFGSLYPGNVSGVLEPMQERYFDWKNKRLICFNKGISKSDEFLLVKLHHDFCLIVSEGKYSGFIVSDPLRYITGEKEGEIDIETSPDMEEYFLMARFFNIMSDNNVYASDNDMTKVVSELKDKILPDIGLIVSQKRRRLVKNTVFDLLDFYC